MAIDRQTPCFYYICAGLCKKGRKASHAHYCQHCDKYEPRARVKYKNRKKEKLEKIRKGEMRQDIDDCDIDCTIVKCKYCGTESHSVHSKYTRTISVLPIQNYQVKLIITVPKFFCTNEKCSHKTFAYPIPFADKNSLRTNRMDDYIYQIGMKSSSLDAEKQISGSHVSVSNNTILRIIKKNSPCH